MKKLFLHALILSIVMIFTCFSVRAEEPVPLSDPDGSYQLTVTYVFHDLAEATPVDGAEITVIQVAEVTPSADQELQYVSLYGGKENYSFMSAQERETEAGWLAEKTRNSSDALKAVTEADGVAVFRDLKAGMYLVTETGNTGTAASFERFKPFLIAVPECTADENGQVLHCDAEAYEKAERLRVILPEPEREAVNTGDETDNSQWNIVLLCSVLLFTGSFVMLKWGEEEDTQ